MIKNILILVVGLFLIVTLSYHFYSVYKFTSVGPRFTAKDGQALCRRIQVLEHYSYGFQASKVPGTECHYYEEQ